MYFPTSLFVLVAPLIAAVSAAPGSLARAEHNCLVNAAYNSDWGEGGLQRYRTVFSAENVDPLTYCNFFSSNSRCSSASNIQCAWDTKVNYFRVDASFAGGPAGDDTYWSCLEASRKDWQSTLQCRTG